MINTTNEIKSMKNRVCNMSQEIEQLTKHGTILLNSFIEWNENKHRNVFQNIWCSDI